MTGGGIFAPFIIVNGTIAEALAGQCQVYFPFIAANSDGVDHICMLGNNVFGFEDLPNGGDRDFNDVIVRVSIA
ncbi:MAG: DUF4114 domain-containing protein [Cyanobacteria bacterium]|nr:DUF4114 domain-containing protein [Cyanobacteriota bacterium]MDW8201379.1 DUF4114 domain-containing protein [Cyanobacteriota bacterium SKYGB_h_bin112]